MPPAILTDHLAHRYPSARGEVQALREVSVTIAPGEFFGLFGPNGAGKTTLIRILTTLVTPSSGTAQVQGLDVVRQAGQVRAQLGLVFSNENSFYGRLTGQQNLEFFAALQNLPGHVSRRRVRALLEMFDLSSAARQPVQTYSTGMKQKLNVARALLHDPAVLFLDEPTKGMDVLTAETLRTLLRGELVERQRKTVLLTTHDLQEMEKLCDRVGILEAGRLRAVGTPADLIREASASVIYQLELVGRANGLVDHLERLSSVLSVKVASQTAAATLMELTLSQAPGAELWAALAAHDVQVKRCAPKDDGLVALLKNQPPRGVDLHWRE